MDEPISELVDPASEPEDMATSEASLRSSPGRSQACMRGSMWLSSRRASHVHRDGATLTSAAEEAGREEVEGDEEEGKEEEGEEEEGEEEGAVGARCESVYE